jgi:quinol monooxygenase YgiN
MVVPPVVRAGARFLAANPWTAPRTRGRARRPCGAATAAGIRAQEPGTLVYACHTVDGAPRERIFYELYATRAAFDVHEQTEHTRRFLNQRKDPLEFVHASQYTRLAPILADLIPGLETAARNARSEELRSDARKLLADTYQAVAAAMSKFGEADAAWIAADRTAFTAEATGQLLTVAASMYRMAHVFLSLGQIAQAQQVAFNAAHALEPTIGSETSDEALSLYGALHLVLAVAAARDNDRAKAYGHLDTARGVAERLGADRNDYDTEFGPSNVAIHAVSVAVELGDAGQALDLARAVEADSLSPERRSRYLIYLATAHTMRRQIGEALHDLQEAERITPELTRAHGAAREVTRDLLQLSGLRPRPEMRELAERFGVLP